MRRIALAAGVPLGVLLVAPGAALAADGPTLDDTISAVNTTWVIVAAVLVMFMQAGFLFLEVGFSRAKNAGLGVVKILTNYSICALAYWAVGFALAFGGAGKIAGEFVQELGLGDEFVSAVDLAIRESVANAVKHGNRFDESKMVEVKLELVAAGFEITVRDFGAGFDLDHVPDPTDPANLLKVSGRGILFMQAFMDEVDWVRHDAGGTIVRMLKKG